MLHVLCRQQLRRKSQRRLLKSLLVEATSAISDARRVLEWQRSLQLFATYLNRVETEQLPVEMPIFNAAITETCCRWHKCSTVVVHFSAGAGTWVGQSSQYCSRHAKLEVVGPRPIATVDLICARQRIGVGAMQALALLHSAEKIGLMPTVA